MRTVLALVAACVLALGARAQELAATLACEPAQAVIGEPVEWVLEARHARGERLELAHEDPLEALAEIDRLAWAVVDGPRVERDPSGERTRFRWRVLALESGTRQLPAIVVRAREGAEATASGATLEVWTDLAAGEDLPRPIAGLHDVEVGGALVGPFQIATALVAAGLVAAGWIAWRRRRARARPAAAPSARERLAALRAAGVDDGRAVAFELGRVLRGAVDARAARDLAGLTDEEWIARARADSGADAEALEALLAALATAKYAGEAPTRFRVEEWLASAEALLARIDRDAPEPRRAAEAAA